MVPGSGIYHCNICEMADPAAAFAIQRTVLRITASKLTAYGSRWQPEHRMGVACVTGGSKATVLTQPDRMRFAPPMSV